MVLIARPPSQLQDMLDVCQDRAKRSCMTINHDKKEVMMFYETPLQKASGQTASFHITNRFPLSSPPKTLSLKEPAPLKYLGLTHLDPAFTREAADKYICRKINAVHETVVVVAHIWFSGADKHTLGRPHI